MMIWGAIIWWERWAEMRYNETMAHITHVINQCKYCLSIQQQQQQHFISILVLFVHVVLSITCRCSCGGGRGGGLWYAVKTHTMEHHSRWEYHHTVIRTRVRGSSPDLIVGITILWMRTVDEQIVADITRIHKQWFSTLVAAIPLIERLIALDKSLCFFFVITWFDVNKPPETEMTQGEHLHAKSVAMKK